MKNKLSSFLLIFCLTAFLGCSQMSKTKNGSEVANLNEKIENVKPKTTHRYGGWYCPDNLNGFPAVDINKWEKVPVVNGRMATKEETQNGTSLIL